MMNIIFEDELIARMKDWRKNCGDWFQGGCDECIEPGKERCLQVKSLIEKIILGVESEELIKIQVGQNS